MAEQATKRDPRRGIRQQIDEQDPASEVVAIHPVPPLTVALREVPPVAAPALRMMSDTLRILPDPLLRVDTPCQEDRRLWLSDKLFAALPAVEDRAHLLLSVIDQPGAQGGALEVRCTRPAGVAWMTLEFVFGDAFAQAIRGRTAIGVRLRAKALPAITVAAKCAFHTAEGNSLIDFAQTCYITHEYNLFERELNIAGTSLEQADGCSELRIFLGLPQSAYFALVVSHAELYVV